MARPLWRDRLASRCTRMAGEASIGARRAGFTHVRDEQEKRQAILESVAGCDTSTLVRLHALLTGAGDNRDDSGKGYLDYLQAVAESDVAGLKISEKVVWRQLEAAGWRGHFPYARAEM